MYWQDEYQSRKLRDHSPTSQYLRMSVIGILTWLCSILEKKSIWVILAFVSVIVLYKTSSFYCDFYCSVQNFKVFTVVCSSWLCRHKGNYLGREVTIKILKPEHINFRTLRILSEQVHHMRYCNHPFNIDLYKYWPEDVIGSHKPI